MVFFCSTAQHRCCLKGEIMTALATLRDVGFEEWLGKSTPPAADSARKRWGRASAGRCRNFAPMRCVWAWSTCLRPGCTARRAKSPAATARTFYRLPAARQRVDGTGREPDGALSRRHHADRRLTAQQLHLPARFAPNLAAVAARLPAGAAALPSVSEQSSARCASAANWC